MNVYFNSFGGGIIAGIFRINGLFSKLARRPGSAGDYVLVITGRDGFIVVELLAVC